MPRPASSSTNLLKTRGRRRPLGRLLRTEPGRTVTLRAFAQEELSGLQHIAGATAGATRQELFPSNCTQRRPGRAGSAVECRVSRVSLELSRNQRRLTLKMKEGGGRRR